MNIFEAFRRSFSASFGDIVFGMEDGTVSIFGLVFGMAASAPDSRTVLLAGATGAAAAAISMMAGTYLEAQSTRGQARVRIAEVRRTIAQDHPGKVQEIADRLGGVEVSPEDQRTFLELLGRSPLLLFHLETWTEQQLLEDTQRSPVVRSLWMLAADLLAAFLPVLPFACFSLASAQVCSLLITALLLALLGIGRGVMTKNNVGLSVLETLSIAAAAALAGFLIGRLVFL